MIMLGLFPGLIVKNHMAFCTCEPDTPERFRVPCGLP
jgi:hypothetical protein